MYLEITYGIKLAFHFCLDMKDTFKRLFTNGILMCNNLASIFYLLGAMPLFIFAPKYLEIMFAQSAAFANIISGKPYSTSSLCAILYENAFSNSFMWCARRYGWISLRGCRYIIERGGPE